MRRANAGQPTRHDLAALGHELAQHAVVLVVNVLDFLDAELANFLAPKKLASTFARRPTRTASAASPAKSRTISAGTISATTGTPFFRRRCCSGFFSHNSPSSVLQTFHCRSLPRLVRVTTHSRKSYAVTAGAAGAPSAAGAAAGASAAAATATPCALPVFPASRTPLLSPKR